MALTLGIELEQLASLLLANSDVEGLPLRAYPKRGLTL